MMVGSVGLHDSAFFKNRWSTTEADAALQWAKDRAVEERLYTA
jgi:hypothetical protein